jgi:hypothetical protein
MSITRDDLGFFFNNGYYYNGKLYPLLNASGIGSMADGAELLAGDPAFTFVVIGFSIDCAAAVDLTLIDDNDNILSKPKIVSAGGTAKENYDAPLGNPIGITAGAAGAAAKGSGVRVSLKAPGTVNPQTTRIAYNVLYIQI